MRLRNRTLGALAVSAALVGLGSVAQATILPFTENDGNSKPVPAGYADNVAGSPQGGFTYSDGGEGWTPNVTATFGGSTYTYNGAYGDLVPVVFASASAGGDLNKIRVTLTADAGYLVHLYSMDLAPYGSGSGTRTADSITVTDGSNTLFNGTGTQLDATKPVHNTVSFDPNVVKGSVLYLVIDLTTDHSTDYGMKNLRFGQSLVPEPASLGLVGLGALGLLARRRRA